MGRFRDSSAMAGWLFADFMLALGMLFVVANTVGSKVPPDSPNISGFTPTSGPIHTQVRISGSNFNDVQEVHFGAGLAVRMNVDSDLQITAEVPVDATTGLITVVTAHGIATSPGPFTLVVMPTPTATPTATPSLTPTPTATPVPTVTPTPSPTPKARIVEKDCWSYALDLGTDVTRLTTEPTRSGVAGMLADMFSGARDGSRQAGFVLTFAQANDDSSSTRAAQQMNELLVSTLPDVFDGAAQKAYLARGRNPGRVEIQVYYLSGGDPITGVASCTD